MELLERTGRKEIAWTGNGRREDPKAAPDGQGRLSGRAQIPGTSGWNDAGYGFHKRKGQRAVCKGCKGASGSHRW